MRPFPFFTAVILVAVAVSAFPHSAILTAQQPNCTYSTSTTIVDTYLGDTTVADFDNDGHIDAAVVGFEIDVVLIFRNNADGTFAQPLSFEIDLEATVITSGDMDNDSDIDLVIGNSLSNSVSVLLNNGDGTFSAREDYLVSFDKTLQINRLSLIDLDGDNDLDLAVTNVSSDPKIELPGTLSLLENDGTGAFAMHETIAVGFCPSGMKPMDIDGDNDPDLLLATEGEKEDGASALLFFENDGAGNLSIAFEIENRHGGNTSITTTDLDGDSLEDLILFSGSSTYSVFFGCPASPTNYEAKETVFPFSGLIQGMEFIDIDTDGDQEIVIPSGVLDRVGFVFNNSGRNFSQIQYASIGMDANRIFKGDFDANDETDFLIIHRESMSLVVLTFECETPTPGCQFAMSTLLEIEEPRGLKAADFNNDKHVDLAVTFGEASLAIFIGNGDGTFNEPSFFDTDLFPERMDVGDIDGDNDLDIVIENSTMATTVSVMVNDGIGNFPTRSEVPLFVAGLASPTFVQLADTDNDNDLDLIVCVGVLGTSGSFGFIYENENGVFEFNTILSTPGFPSMTGNGDLDDDGDVDVVYNDVFSDPAGLSVFYNDGDNFFSSANFVQTGGAGTSPGEASGSGPFCLGDFNGNSCLDAVVADRASNTLATLAGQPNGEFGPPALSPISIYLAALKMEPVDIDRDNDLDLLIVNSFPNNILLALNDGEGNFELDSAENFGQRPFALTTADIDEDGSLEVIVTHNDSGTIDTIQYDCNSRFVLGDVNMDGTVNLLDVAPFVELLVNGDFQMEADINQDGSVDLLDVEQFVNLLIG